MISQNALIFFSHFLSFLGIEEINKDNNFSDTAFVAQLKSFGWKPGDKYCCYGLKCVVDSSQFDNDFVLIYGSDFLNAFTGSVSQTYTNLKDFLDESSSAKSGSLFFRFTKNHGNHCGFVWYACKDGSFYSLEFNSNNQVRPVYHNLNYYKNATIKFFEIL